MNRKKLYFLLYASCIPVSGYMQSIIYDIQNKIGKVIPNDLFYFIKASKDIEVEVLKKNYKNQYNDLINNILDYFTSENIGFYTTNPELFPKIDLYWEEPFAITNIIFDIAKNVNLYENLFSQINNIGCQSLQIRYLYSPSIFEIENILKNLYDSRLRSIDLFLKYNADYKKEDYYKMLHIDGRIFNIYIYSAPYNKDYHPKNKPMSYIYLRKANIDNNNCGNISPEYFNINLSLLTESQKHNTCLNRKLCIDADGNIKNCPSMSQSYGNIKDISLEDVIEQKEFQDLWFIAKDQIDVCKDCEFRYMCTDCRCFIKDPENVYSQPAKCSYNPYIAKWEKEDGYVPVEECGTYSRETGFIPNHEKIALLNNK